MSSKRIKLAVLRQLACAWMAGSCCLHASAGGEDGEPWRVAADVDTVTVRINWVSVNALKRAAREIGRNPPSRPEGFAVLRLDTRSGGFTCDIYMIERPRRVGDSITDSLGHEVAHCLGFSHENVLVNR